MCEGDSLTVAQHFEDSSGANSVASPGAHSPPFNTSSESGDSGVESGIYSLVGECLQFVMVILKKMRCVFTYRICMRTRGCGLGLPDQW